MKRKKQMKKIKKGKLQETKLQVRNQFQGNFEIEMTNMSTLSVGDLVLSTV